MMWSEWEVLLVREFFWGKIVVSKEPQSFKLCIMPSKISCLTELGLVCLQNRGRVIVCDYNPKMIDQGRARPGPVSAPEGDPAQQSQYYYYLASSSLRACRTRRWFL